MSPRGARALSCVVVALAAAACEQEAPPALPFADVFVDTNVDVPRTLSRVRIDVYGGDGRWLHSRDYPMTRAEDWPTSFGVVAPDDRETTALVRVRGYVTGAVRDYRGERTPEPVSFTPATLPTTVADVCASAPLLPPLEERTFRIGPEDLTRGKACRSAQGSGAAAVTVRIERRDRYHFGIVRMDPPVEDPVSPVLLLRRNCTDADTEIACDAPGRKKLPGIIVDLDPGEYTLLASDRYDFEREEVTLRWSTEAEWGVAPVARALEPEKPRPLPSMVPRLTSGGEDVTPRSEPSPEAAIDTLVRVRLVPGAPLRTRVLLDGACLGQPSSLVVRDDGTVDADKSASCIGGAPASVPLARLVPGEIAASARGTFPPGEGCLPEMSDERVVCVPGGTYVIGATETDLTSVLAPDTRTLPLRAVALHRFFLDRHEVTVGRYRQALGQGFSSKTSSPPYDNPSANALGPTTSSDYSRTATFSAEPVGREDFPLNAVSWDRAREICRFYGGDLPTEAQWEYAALAAGRTRKATYPWGESEPTCDGVVFGRDPDLKSYTCPGLAYGPRPVDGDEGTEDVTPLGVLGMGGNVREHVRDTYAPYDADCWRAAGALDPACVDDTSPWRVIRGNSWQYPHLLQRSAYRAREAASSRRHDVGVRCAYKKAPVRTWVGP